MDFKFSGIKFELTTLTEKQKLEVASTTIKVEGGVNHVAISNFHKKWTLTILSVNCAIKQV